MMADFLKALANAAEENRKKQAQAHLDFREEAQKQLKLRVAADAKTGDAMSSPKTTNLLLLALAVLLAAHPALELLRPAPGRYFLITRDTTQFAVFDT